jgi:hypothetical protein
VENPNQRIDLDWLLRKAKHFIILRGDVITIPQTENVISLRGRQKSRLEALTAVEHRGEWYLGRAVYAYMRPWREGEPLGISVYRHDYSRLHQNDKEGEAERLIITQKPLWSPAHSLMGLKRRWVITVDGNVKLPLPPEATEQTVRMQERLILGIGEETDPIKVKLRNTLATRLQALHEEILAA